jgi:K+-transporting ATPase KdpF subunit
MAGHSWSNIAPVQRRDLAMTNILLMVVTGALIAYLFAAMLWPERF